MSELYQLSFSVLEPKSSRTQLLNFKRELSDLLEKASSFFQQLFPNNSQKDCMRMIEVLWDSISGVRTTPLPHSEQHQKNFRVGARWCRRTGRM